MKRLIRYKVKADRASENQQFVQKVFEELHRLESSRCALRHLQAERWSQLRAYRFC